MGVSEEIKKPEYATAIGLMYADAEFQEGEEARSVQDMFVGKKKKAAKGDGWFAKILKKFK